MSAENNLAAVAVAIGEYVNNNVSLGCCAQMANMSKESIIKYLGRNGA